jgi:hypothetical protein
MAVRSVIPFLLASLTNPSFGAEATPFSMSFPSAGFERIAQERGVTVFKDKHADVIRIAAEGVLRAPLSDVERALLDYNHQVGVIARLSESRILRRGPNRFTVYQRLNLPIISDRDYVLEVAVGQTRDVRWISFRAVNDPTVPSRSGVVRVSRHVGSWQLKPAEGGRATLARFQTDIDLGGWLPMWMAKSSAGKELPQVFSSVCHMLDRSEERSLSCR